MWVDYKLIKVHHAFVRLARRPMPLQLPATLTIALILSREHYDYEEII